FACDAMLPARYAFAPAWPLRGGRLLVLSAAGPIVETTVRPTDVLAQIGRQGSEQPLGEDLVARGPQPLCITPKRVEDAQDEPGHGCLLPVVWETASRRAPDSSPSGVNTSGTSAPILRGAEELP